MLRISADLFAISAGAVLLWRVSSLGAGELAKHPGLHSASVDTAATHLQMDQKGSDMKTISARIAAAVDDLGEEHFATEMLSTTESEAHADMEQLQQGLSRVIESLTFRPWMEAKVLEGFPEFTPVHHIGTVEIIDPAEQNVVSIGVRGRMTSSSLTAAHRRLLKCLDDHKSEYHAAGPLPRMGYNCPFISEDRAFFEVQIPVEKFKTTVVARSSSYPLWTRGPVGRCETRLETRLFAIGRHRIDYATLL